MQELVAFFMRYLLAPVIIIIAGFLMNYLSKGRAVLKLKKLVVFVLLLSLIMALPSLLGLLKYEFIWGGILLCVVIYFILGVFFNLFSKTNFFKSIGYKENPWLILLTCFIAMVLGGWIFYLVFTWISKLDYGVFAMLSVLWFLIPILYSIAKKAYIKIPSAFYKSWTISKDAGDEEFWNTIDTFRLMQVTVKVKRKFDSKQYSSFSVKLPEEVTLGRWYNRFIEDQNIRFPNTPIELGDGDNKYNWIFYTNKWFPFPLFTRVLDFDKNISENRIKNKATLYARRVTYNENINPENPTEE